MFGAVALLPQQAAAQFAEKKVLTLEIARKIVATAETEAARNHPAGVVAVVDDGGARRANRASRAGGGAPLTWK